MRRLKRFLSGTLAVMLCVVLDFNPMATLLEAMYMSNLIQGPGYFISDLFMHDVKAANEVTLVPPTDSSGDERLSHFLSATYYNLSHLQTTQTGFRYVTGQLTNENQNGIGLFYSRNYNIDYSFLQIKTDDGNMGIRNHLTQAFGDCTQKSDLNTGEINTLGASDFGIIYNYHMTPPNGYNYRVARVWSLNNLIPDTLWKPKADDIPLLENLPYFTVGYANVDFSTYDMSSTTADMHNAIITDKTGTRLWTTAYGSIADYYNQAVLTQGSISALNTLGPDIVIRCEGVVSVGDGFKEELNDVTGELSTNEEYKKIMKYFSSAQIKMNKQQTIFNPFVLPTNTLSINNESVTGAAGLTSIQNRTSIGDPNSLDTMLDPTQLVYFYQLIPNNEITVDDVVQMLYKSKGMYNYNYTYFTQADNSIDPATSKLAQGLSDITEFDTSYGAYYLYTTRSNPLNLNGSLRIDDNKDPLVNFGMPYSEMAVNAGLIKNGESGNIMNGADFILLVANFMKTYGEPVMSDQEIMLMLQVYGSEAPVGLTGKYLEAWKYLKAKGCLPREINMANPISLNEALEIIACVADPNSRTNFKEVQVTLELTALQQSAGLFPATNQGIGVADGQILSTANYNTDYYDVLLYCGTLSNNGSVRSNIMKNGDGTLASNLVCLNGSIEPGCINTLKTYLSSSTRENFLSNYCLFIGIETDKSGNNYYHFQVKRSLYTERSELLGKIYGGTMTDDDWKKWRLLQIYVVPQYLSPSGITNSESEENCWLDFVNVIDLSNVGYGGVYTDFELDYDIMPYQILDGGDTLFKLDSNLKLQVLSDTEHCKYGENEDEANKQFGYVKYPLIKPVVKTVTVSSNDADADYSYDKPNTFDSLNDDNFVFYTDWLRAGEKADDGNESTNGTSHTTTEQARAIIERENPTLLESFCSIFTSGPTEVEAATATIGSNCMITLTGADESLVGEYLFLCQNVISTNWDGTDMVTPFPCLEGIEISLNGDFSSLWVNMIRNMTEEEIYTEIAETNKYLNEHCSWADGASETTITAAKKKAVQYISQHPLALLTNQYFDVMGTAENPTVSAENVKNATRQKANLGTTSETVTFRLSFEGAVKFMKSDSYDSGLYAKYFDPMRASENDAIRVTYTNGEWTVSSRNVDTARVVAMGLTGCADLDEISELYHGDDLGFCSVADSVVMSETQLLIKYSDMLDYGWVVNNSRTRLPKCTDGVYSLQTKYGSVEIDTNNGIIVIGTTMYRITDRATGGPATLVITPSGDDSNYYFDYRCVLGICSNRIVSSGSTTMTINCMAEPTSGLGTEKQFNLMSLDQSKYFATMPVTAKSYGVYSDGPTIPMITATSYDGQDITSQVADMTYWPYDVNGSWLASTHEGMENVGYERVPLRISLQSFAPLANWVTVVSSDQNGIQGSLYVWYHADWYTQNLVNQATEMEELARQRDNELDSLNAEAAASCEAGSIDRLIAQRDDYIRRRNATSNVITKVGLTTQIVQLNRRIAELQANATNLVPLTYLSGDQFRSVMRTYLPYTKATSEDIENGTDYNSKFDFDVTNVTLTSEYKEGDTETINGILPIYDNQGLPETYTTEQLLKESDFVTKQNMCRFLTRQQTIKAYTSLYQTTGGGYYGTSELACREFDLTNATVSNPQGGLYSKALGERVSANTPGVCYWLDYVGFVYNVPSIEDFSYEDYLSGEILLPVYYQLSDNGTSVQLVFVNPDNIVIKDIDNNMTNDMSQVTINNTGYFLAEEGVGNVFDIKKGIGEMVPYSQAVDSWGADTNIADSLPYEIKSYAAIAPAIFLGTNAGDFIVADEISPQMVGSNYTYLGSARLVYNANKSTTANTCYTRYSTQLPPISLASDKFKFYQVYDSRTYSGNVLIADGGNVTYAKGHYVSGAEETSDGKFTGTRTKFQIQLENLIKTIDTTSNWIFWIACIILPMIFIIILTALVGFAFISDTKFFQMFCEKAFDPISMLTFGKRNVYDWKWQTVLFPLIIMYIACALLLNANLIRVIVYLMEWVNATWSLVL